jgi:hypothetical protein
MDPDIQEFIDAYCLKQKWEYEVYADSVAFFYYDDEGESHQIGEFTFEEMRRCIQAVG